jgi:hypothetical protein
MTVTRANGTEASPTIVSIGDHLGQIAFQGYDGATVQTTGLIRATVESAPSAGNVPTGYTFWTGSSSGTISQKMVLRTDGKLGINVTIPSELLHISGNLFLNSDSDKLLLGAGKDFSVYYDGTSGYLKADEVAASDLHVTTGTAKTIVYDTPVWDDLNFDPERAGGPVATRPDPVTINNVFHAEFTSENNQLCGAVEELPHKYKLSSDLTPHMHLFLKGGESAGTTGVTFTYYWELRQSTGTTSGSLTLSATSAQLGTTAGANQYIVSGTAFAGSAELGGQLSVTLARTAGDAGDVVVTTYGCHYQVDTPGSRTITTK